MPSEPVIKRAIAFFDGQNLFHAAKSAFGCRWPNYDPKKLAHAICQEQGWVLEKTCFYTGFPDIQDNFFWNHFWIAKLAQMKRLGVQTFSRPLKYRNQSVFLSDGTESTVLVGSEKGIDVRLALDSVAAASNKACDVILIFSQDQDLSEAADEIKTISEQQNRWIKVACAYPISPISSNKRGINNTEWIKFGRITYNSCIDNRDYRPK